MQQAVHQSHAATMVPDGALRLSACDKSLPAWADGSTVGEFLAHEPSLDDFLTPLVVLDAGALEHNISFVAEWAAAQGLTLMPHGKTTMAPALWRKQLDAGAQGITVATPWQARVARCWGVSSVHIANAVVDPNGLTFLSEELRDPAFSVQCWADSTETVDVMDGVLDDVDMLRPLPVCVELGVAGGRTGARTKEGAVAVAERVARSPHLELAGVAGYEGVIRSPSSSHVGTAVRGYLDDLVELAEAVAPMVQSDRLILSVGGSTFPDLVAAVMSDWGRSRADIEIVLRSGAYLTHDSGHYDRVSPWGAVRNGGRGLLRPAVFGLARVVSSPEPGLVLLDGGKRDFPYDEGMPTGVARAADLSGTQDRPLVGTVEAMNDQHAYLRVAPDEACAPGEVVTLGLSHPCTVFDKWRWIPVVEQRGSTRITDVIRTWF